MIEQFEKRRSATECSRDCLGIYKISLLSPQSCDHNTLTGTLPVIWGWMTKKWTMEFDQNYTTSRTGS